MCAAVVVADMCATHDHGTVKKVKGIRVALATFSCSHHPQYLCGVAKDGR